MRLLDALWFRLRAIFRPAQLKIEFDEELRFHIERETQENIARGMPPDDARRTALAQFGGVERFKENLRDERSVRWLDDIAADVRHGVRLLRKNTMFSGAVIVTLALGIGATSTIFTIVNGVLLRPLPYPRADRIVSISESMNGVDGSVVGQFASGAWAESARSFGALALYSPASGVLTGAGEPVELKGTAVTEPFFAAMGSPVAFGRTFAPAELLDGGPRVIVLSHEFWKRAFGGDSTVLNRTIQMSGRPRTIIGVMPAGFDFPGESRYWVPLTPPSVSGTEFYFSVLARLRDGVSPEAAERELRNIAPRVDSLRSALNRGAAPVVMTLHDRLFGSVRKPLTILMGAVVVLMLIACANVANLTLARSAARSREFAVRLALGAGRWRLVRQLLVESSILALLGGALGLLMPVVLVGAFARLSPTSVAGVNDIHVDATVLVFTAAVSVLAALLFGLAPAWTGVRAGTSSALASGSVRVSGSRSHRAVRAALVVFEVSAALTLITGAALLTKSFRKATDVQPGFVANSVYGAGFRLPSARYPNNASQSQFLNQVAAEVRGAPGVQALSLSSTRPLRGYSYSKKMAASPDDAARFDVAFADVDSSYARVVGLHLKAGRFLNETDVRGAAPAAMITASAARLLFPGIDPLGRTIDAGSETHVVVVGVIDDVAQWSVDVTPVPQVFLSTMQGDNVPSQIIIRASLSTAAVRALLKQAVQHADPLQPLTNFYVLSDDVAQSVAPRRFNSLLVNAFAVCALLLAMVGLYGLMAHAVATRTRELGIRMALGAQTDNVLLLVLRQGFVLVAVGIAAGVVMSLVLSRTVASLLYDMPAVDPSIFVGAALVLATVALLACYIPARRAMRISPMNALRQD